MFAQLLSFVRQQTVKVIKYSTSSLKIVFNFRVLNEMYFFFLNYIDSQLDNICSGPTESKLTNKFFFKKKNYLNFHRSIQRERNFQSSKKIKEDRIPSSELPLPQTSTLRSRRRLANMLVAAALIFVCCWSPHVICYLCF